MSVQMNYVQMLIESSGLILACFLVVLSWAGFKFLKWKSSRERLYKLAAALPGPPATSLLGNSLKPMTSPHIIFRDILNTVHSDVMKTWIGPRLLVFLTNPSDVELVLGSIEHIDKAPECEFYKPWLGNGLLNSTRELWKAHRRLIAPSFHTHVLTTFIEAFNRNSRNVVKRMAVEGGNLFDCHSYMSEATVEILLETALGVDKTVEESVPEYFRAVTKMCDIVHLRQTKWWLRSDLVFTWSSYGSLQTKCLEIIHGLTTKALSIRKAERGKGLVNLGNISNGGGSKGLEVDLAKEKGGKPCLSVLDNLIDNAEKGVVLNDDEIQNQADTIMFEGLGTTAATSSFFLCVLAARPDIQEKLLDEVDQVFGNSLRDVTFEDVTSLKYLERCIMETLRMFPPLPLIARQPVQDLKLAASDLTIPAGCTVIIPTYKLHRRDDIYPNPEVFDPDRFLPERMTSRHSYSFIPFSAGPRSCIGRKYAMLKLKVLLANFLRSFQVKPGIPMKDWVLQADSFLKRTDGFMVQLEKRASKRTES